MTGTRVLHRFARRWLWWVRAVRKRECILEEVHPDRQWCGRACHDGWGCF